MLMVGLYVSQLANAMLKRLYLDSAQLNPAQLISAQFIAF